MLKPFCKKLRLGLAVSTKDELLGGGLTDKR